MKLTLQVFALRRSFRLTTTQAPSSAHIWAHAFCGARTSRLISAHTQELLCYRLFIRDSALAWSLHSNG